MSHNSGFRNIKAEGHYANGLQLRKAGRHTEALRELIAAYEAWDHSDQSSYMERSGSAMEVGKTLHYGLGEHLKAIQWYRIAHEKDGGKNPVWCASTVSNEAQAWFCLNKFEKALACFQQARSMITGPYGRGHSITQKGIVDCYIALGNVQAAYQNALLGMKEAKRAGDWYWTTQFQDLIKDIQPLSDPGVLDISVNRVMEEESRFAGEFGINVRTFCDLARVYMAGLAEYGFESRLQKLLASVQASSFPTYLMNATVCRLPTGEDFINISPDLLTALRSASMYMASVLDNPSEMRLNELFAVISESIIGTMEAPDLFQHDFPGHKLYKHSIQWILLHELAHIDLGHLDGTRRRPLKIKRAFPTDIEEYELESQIHEYEADHYATEHFVQMFNHAPQQGIGIALGIGTALGLLNGFTVATSAAEPNSHKNSIRTHPLASDRYTSAMDITCNLIPSDAVDIRRMQHTISSMWFSDAAVELFRDIGTSGKWSP